jgi:hypothetical protein
MAGGIKGWGAATGVGNSSLGFGTDACGNAGWVGTMMF